MKTDSNLNFDGMAGDGVNRGSNRFAGNHHTKTNPNALINKGRGPTVGNKSDKDSTYPGADSMPKFSAGKEMTLGCHQPQVRNPAGTREVPNRGKETFNYGRGPLKGNA